MRKLFLFAAAGCFAVSCSRAPEGDFGKVPDFKAMASDAAGIRPFEKSDLDGRPWIAGFFFTRCSGPCPVLTAQMARLQKELPEEVRLVSITVDPEADSPEVLRRYAQRAGAHAGRWTFLRLEPAALYELLYAGFKLPVYKDHKAPTGFRVMHSTRFVLVNQRGRIEGYFEGMEGGRMRKLKKNALKLLARKEVYARG